MPKKHTINLASSEDMILVLLGRITDVLAPLANETGLDATFDITRGEDNLNTISVTVPDDASRTVHRDLHGRVHDVGSALARDIVELAW